MVKIAGLSLGRRADSGVAVTDTSLGELTREVIFGLIRAVQNPLLGSAQESPNCRVVNIWPVAFSSVWVVGVTSGSKYKSIRVSTVGGKYLFGMG